MVLHIVIGRLGSRWLMEAVCTSTAFRHSLTCVLTCRTEWNRLSPGCALSLTCVELRAPGLAQAASRAWSWRATRASRRRRRRRGCARPRSARRSISSRPSATPPPASPPSRPCAPLLFRLCPMQLSQTQYGAGVIGHGFEELRQAFHGFSILSVPVVSLCSVLLVLDAVHFYQ